ncbi:MAG: hypothetical protein IPN94_02090 [Sphingobacteriales bacterium]|nr:hypothetical protein [Sphingobacteriales bacterium]
MIFRHVSTMLNDRRHFTPFTFFTTSLFSLPSLFSPHHNISTSLYFGARKDTVFCGNKAIPKRYFIVYNLWVSAQK